MIHVPVRVVILAPIARNMSSYVQCYGIQMVRSVGVVMLPTVAIEQKGGDGRKKVGSVLWQRVGREEGTIPNAKPYDTAHNNATVGMRKHGLGGKRGRELFFGYDIDWFVVEECGQPRQPSNCFSSASRYGASVAINCCPGAATSTGRTQRPRSPPWWR